MLYKSGLLLSPVSRLVSLRLSCILEPSPSLPLVLRHSVSRECPGGKPSKRLAGKAEDPRQPEMVSTFEVGILDRLDINGR